MKPYVICHMHAPLDGRLGLDSWAPRGSKVRESVLADYQTIHEAFEPDAWLVGTTTMAEYADGQDRAYRQSATRPARPWHQGDSEVKRFAIAIDRHARLRWSSSRADDAHAVMALAASVPDEHLTELAAAGVSYLVMPMDEIDLADALTALNQRLGI